MARVKLGTQDATGMSGLLGSLGKAQEIPADLRRDAAFWAKAVQRKMDDRDLRMVAWLFHDLGGLSSIPRDRQNDARYWAAYLEGRLGPL
jgi:hypothetical protein